MWMIRGALAVLAMAGIWTLIWQGVEWMLG